MLELQHMYEDIELFKGLSESEINKLRVIGKSYKKGSILVSEGDSADRFGIIAEGKAEISSIDWDGNRNIIIVLEKGRMFGEAICVLGKKKYPVTVSALTDCKVIFVPADVIRNPDNMTLALNLMKIMAENSLEFRKKLTLLSHKRTREKILSFLHSESEKKGCNEFTIPFDRQALADYLGVDRAAMSSEIGKLVNDGLIAVDKNHFKVMWK